MAAGIITAAAVIIMAVECGDESIRSQLRLIRRIPDQRAGKNQHLPVEPK